MAAAYEYITQPDGLARVVEALGRCRLIGIDTEGDSLHHYQERTCLLQLTGNGQSWIVDPLVLTDLSTLAPVFGDDKILKVLHGADYDLVCLKRDFGLIVRPIFDTVIAARALGIAKFSLGDLITRFFAVTLDKRYQKADWAQRPLTKEMLDYASNDTRYLSELYGFLRKELEAKGRLEMAEEESQYLTRREWSGKTFEPDDYLRIKGARHLPPEGQRIVRALAVARDQEARRLDRPPFKVLSAQDILALALAQPKTPGDLARLFPRASHPIRRHEPLWLEAIAHGVRDQSPLPLQEVHRGRRLSRAQRDLLGRLQAWRNEQAKTEGVEPAMVLSMDELTGVVIECTGLTQNAQKNRVAADAIGRLPFLRNWQKTRYGAALARLLSS